MRVMKIVLQDGMKDCGICSLLSIVKYYNGNVSKECLREMTNTTKNGVTAYNLIEAGRKIGFNSYALKGELEEINLSNLPCIAHVIVSKTYQHFVVIYEINFKNNKVIIMDPAKGKRVLTIAQFKLMSSNNYLFFIPNKKLPKLINSKIIKQSIIEFSKKDKKSIIFILILTISYFIFNIFSAFHFKYLLDFAIDYRVSNNIKIISTLILSIYIIKDISFSLRNILLSKYSILLDYFITTKIYKQLILLPYLYYKNRTTGEILSRVKDISVIKNYIINLFTIVSVDTISCLIFIILLFNINETLTIYTCVFFLLLIIINFCYKKGCDKKLKKYYRKEEKLNSYLIESLSSMEVIKGMHTEKITLDKLKIKYQKFLESVYNLSFQQEVHIFVKNSVNNLFQIIILGFGGFYVIREKMNLSSLITYQSILNFLISSINNVSSLIYDYTSFKLSKERIEDLFNIRKENFNGSSYYTNINLNGRIIYKNLNYSVNNRIILNNINITINPKDKVFLSGPSGSGKSTFVKILMRYLEIPFGTVDINDIDINHYHLDILRNKITYVSQQEFLFTDTLYNNVTLHKDYDENKVSEVFKLMLVDEFVKEKESYNKLVEENGFNFSGGERQRIILARTMLKSSDIYIFDEALSQIDIERERKILKNIFRYLKDKVVIIISHRNDNKDLFNRIFEIRDGRLNEKKL